MSQILSPCWDQIGGFDGIKYLKQEVKSDLCNANFRQFSKLMLVHICMASSPQPRTTWSALACLPLATTTSVVCWLQFNSEAYIFSTEHLGSLQAVKYDVNGKNRKKYNLKTHHHKPSRCPAHCSNVGTHTGHPNC